MYIAMYVHISVHACIHVCLYICSYILYDFSVKYSSSLMCMCIMV